MAKHVREARDVEAPEPAFQTNPISKSRLVNVGKPGGGVFISSPCPDLQGDWLVSADPRGGVSSDFVPILLIALGLSGKAMFGKC